MALLMPVTASDGIHDKDVTDEECRMSVTLLVNFASFKSVGPHSWGVPAPGNYTGEPPVAVAQVCVEIV